MPHFRCNECCHEEEFDVWPPVDQICPDCKAMKGWGLAEEEPIHRLPFRAVENEDGDIDIIDAHDDPVCLVKVGVIGGGAVGQIYEEIRRLNAAFIVEACNEYVKEEPN